MALKYDADNGQIFTETICSVLPVRPDWTQCRRVIGRNEPEERPFLNWSLRDKKRRRKKIDAKQKPVKGASNLFATCERACTDNLDRLRLPVLRELPVHLGRQIHDIAMERDLLSLNFWKAFVRTYHRTSANYDNDDDMQKLSLYRARFVFIANLSMQDFAFPLKTHVSYTVSQSCEWLSAISIQRCRPDLADFMSLADLPNLAFLQLEKVSSFKDEIPRAWSQRVMESDGSAFAKLRILSLHGMYVTKLCFGYLEALPALHALSMDGHFDGSLHSKVGSWELLSKPNSAAANQQRTTIKQYERKLLQKFLSLDLEERPLLWLHHGPHWTFTHGLSYLRLLDRHVLEILQQEKDRLTDEWAGVRWWFRSDSTQSIAGPRGTPEEVRTASRKSTVVAPTKMKRIDNILGDLM